MKTYVLLTILCFLLIPTPEATAIQMTPGGLVIQGQMYVTGDPVWDPDLGKWISEDGWFPFYIPTQEPPPWWQESGDPQDLMYHSSTEIGVKEGVFDISLGTFENGSTIYLGHAIHTIDLTVQATTSGLWPGSQNLRLELRSPMPGSDTVYWSATGPFSSEPLHAYLEFPQPTAGYEVRLTAVPEVSPVLTLSFGLGVALCRWRRRR